jgi:hypothetical protein
MLAKTASTSATTTKNIYANGLLIATIDDTTAVGSTTASSPIHYIATDNLGSTNVVMDQSGKQVEGIDYYPYGQARVDTITNPHAGAKYKYAQTQ